MKQYWMACMIALLVAVRVHAQMPPELCAGIEPQAASASAVYDLVILGGSLIDGSGSEPVDNTAVAVRDRRIVSVNDPVSLCGAQITSVIDAHGMTVMPGLIDLNKHLQLNPLYHSSGVNLPTDALVGRWEENLAKARQRAHTYLMQGVTSIRQTSGPQAVMRDMQQSIDAGEVVGPRVFLGGALLMSTPHFNDYMRLRQMPASSRDWLRTQFAYRLLDDIPAATADLTGPAVDYWKLYLSDQPFDGSNDFTDAELTQIIETAHAHGKKVDVHAGGSNAGLRRALQFDIDTLEHPFYGSEIIADDVIEMIRSKQIIVASLLTVMISYADWHLDPNRFNETRYIMSLSPDEYRVLMHYRDSLLARQREPELELPLLRTPDGGPLDGLPLHMAYLANDLRSAAAIEAARQISLENMRRFIRAGIRLGMGTDAPAFMVFPQEDPVVRELNYMVELGMTPMEALVSATHTGAVALGREQDLGRIAPGYLADIILVPGDPLTDLDALRRVAVVIKDGVRYK